MNHAAHSPAELAAQRCVACEGGVSPYTLDQIQTQLAQLPGWQLTADGQRIRQAWAARNFVAAMEFLQRVADLAETEQHHPDLHLTSYRQVAIEIWTHAIGGLSENDFVLAAKIDQLRLLRTCQEITYRIDPLIESTTER